MTLYGVFVGGDSDDDGALVRTADTAEDALKFLGKYILFRAYGDVPTEILQRILTALDKARGTNDVSPCYLVNGLVYYVSILSEEELETLAVL